MTMTQTMAFEARPSGATSAFGLCGKARPRTEVPYPSLAAKPTRPVDATSGRGDARRERVLRYVQPALNGLIDGSISTLAPLFAVAFATRDDWKTFLVGMAASLGAGVSMGFAEGLSDDGRVSGRGSPLTRGAVCGLATAVGGIGHAMPYLMRDFRAATAVAGAVVFVELWAIAWIRARFMDTPMAKAMLQVVLGGAIVLAVGVAMGSA